MRISDLLAIEELHLRLLAGDPGRAFDTVHITDLPEPGRYLSGGELVLTGLMWRHSPADSARFVAALAEAGVTALGAGQAWLGHVPQDLVDACEQAGLPLLEVPTETSFRTLTELVTPRLSGDARDALGRHRRLLAAVADGAGLPELFALTAAELGVTGAVVSAAGHVILGSPADPVRLARAYLTAPRLPCLAGGHTVFGVGRGHRAAGWALACDGDLLDRPDLGYELAACVELERGRMEEGRRVERRLTGHLVQGAASGADPAELSARLRTCGLDDTAPYAIVTATTRPTTGHPTDGESASGAGQDNPPGGESGRGAGVGPAGVGAGFEVVGGRRGEEGVLDGWVLEELLGREVVAAAIGGGAVAVVPLRGRAVEELAGRLRAGAEVLGALPGTRVCVGVSGALIGAAALKGGLDEAGHAVRLARGRSGGVATSDEIYTHALLLATVPGDVRASFADRLLGPLRDYDTRHQSELVRTLATFLDCAGSWNACAERMHVHVNTVRYRVKRVEELTGKDLSTMADRVDFFLALRAG
ncbi:PucR family transcriptional regulator [Nonomuraea sp. NPDC049714]|uniref:PucR family transcriptional regulator n=1 Tax=Nonomuraea sp. NPDC049714 TaxID=3364357 RepID=UPI0037A78CBE